jgi:hypothetical protein
MGLGLLMAPANLFFLFGWTASIKGDRVATVFRAGCALLLGVLGSGACWHDMRGYPAFYLWIASFAALLVAGLIVPRPPSKGNCPFGFKDRRWAKRAGRRRCPLALAQPRVRQSTAGLATPSNLTRSTISARASWSRSLAVLKIGSMISGVQSNRLLSLSGPRHISWTSHHEQTSPPPGQPPAACVSLRWSPAAQVGSDDLQHRRPGRLVHRRPGCNDLP